MPSVTPRTHGGHGWPPPLVPRIEPRVLRAMPMSRRIPDLIRPAPADAADPDTVHAHLLTAVHQPPEPARAPAWTRQRLTTASRRARRAGPRPNAAPKGRPEPEDRRAAAGTARKAPERSEPAIRPLLLRSRRHTRRGEQRPVCAGRAVGYPGLTAARLPGGCWCHPARQAEGSRVPGSWLRVRMGGHERGQDAGPPMHAVGVRDIL